MQYLPVIFTLSFTACGKKNNNKDGPIAIIVPSASHGWMAGITILQNKNVKN